MSYATKPLFLSFTELLILLLVAAVVGFAAGLYIGAESGTRLAAQYEMTR